MIVNQYNTFRSRNYGEMVSYQINLRQKLASNQQLLTIKWPAIMAHVLNIMNVAFLSERLRPIRPDLWGKKWEPVTLARSKVNSLSSANSPIKSDLIMTKAPIKVCDPSIQR